MLGGPLFAISVLMGYYQNMLNEYISKKLKRARYKRLKDGTYFCEIPSLKGVWANAENLGSCREGLQEVLEDWLFLKVRDREKVPGFAFRVDQRRLVRHG